MILTLETLINMNPPTVGNSDLLKIDFETEPDIYQLYSGAMDLARKILRRLETVFGERQQLEGIIAVPPKFFDPGNLFGYELIPEVSLEYQAYVATLAYNNQTLIGPPPGQNWNQYFMNLVAGKNVDAKIMIRAPWSLGRLSWLPDKVLNELN